MKKLGDTIADYADAVGTAAATGTGHVWLKWPVTYVAKLLRSKCRHSSARLGAR